MSMILSSEDERTELQVPLLQDEENDSTVFNGTGNSNTTEDNRDSTNTLRYPEANGATTTEVDEAAPSWKGLLFYRTLFFFNGLSGVSWGRFGVIYYNTVRHLSQTQIGIISGVLPFLSFFTQPCWGYLADRIQSRKRVYLWNKVAIVVALLSLLIPPPSPRWNFPAVLLSASGTAIFRSRGVLDAHTMDFLGPAHGDMYGSIRLYTSISWGFGSVVMGYLTDDASFNWNFGVFAVMMSANVLFILWGLPERSESERRRYAQLAAAAAESSDERQQGDAGGGLQWAPLVQALWKWQVCVWLMEVSVIGAAMSLVDAFLFVYLQNDLQATTVLCGYSVCVTVLFEIPIFAHGGWFLKNVGHDGLMITALIAYGTRVLGYTQLTPSTVHYVLGLEVLHGVTFACMWVASVDYSAKISPAEWSTTVQSILSTVMNCVGGGIGPVVGGIVFQQCGAKTMYLSAAYTVFAVLILRLCLRFAGHGHDIYLEEVMRRTNNETTDTLEAQDDFTASRPSDALETQDDVTASRPSGTRMSTSATSQISRRNGGEHSIMAKTKDNDAEDCPSRDMISSVKDEQNLEVLDVADEVV